MKLSAIKDQRGVAHLGLIVGAVLVLGVVGFAGWRVMNKDKANNSLSSSQAAAFKCDIDDKDLCKFYSNWKENKYYRVASKSTDKEGKTSESTYESVGTDKFRMVMTGEFAMEMITIGDTSYTKDQSDGKWWKQSLKAEEKDNYSLSDDVAFDEPTESEEVKDKTTYKKIGKEACGDLTCFKYQVIDPEAKDQTDYIWFDDKDYQLRRMTSEGPDGKTDMTFSYDKVEINEPSPVKEVPAGQTVVPGSSEPMSTPSEAEMQQMMEQYGQ